MLRLSFFGHLRITRDDAVLDSLLNQRTRLAVLLYLAEEREVSRERLISIFWEDSDDARHALSQTLYALRQNLGGDFLQVVGDSVVISADVQTDTQQFEQALNAGDADTALRLYQGSFLRDWRPEGSAVEHWVDARRAYYLRKYRGLVRARVDTLAQQGLLEDALTCAETAARVEPQGDEFHHASIDLLARMGRRNDALARFAAYEKMLRADGNEPLEQTVVLARSLQATSVPVPTRAPTTIAVRAPTPGPTVAPPQPARRRRTRLAFSGAAIIAVMSLGLWAALANPPAEIVSDGDLLPDMTAILPFAELASAQHAARADSLRARIHADLRRNPQMQLADLARTDRSAREAGGLRSVARELKALVLVGGSVTTTDSATTLAIQVWDGGTGSTIDSKRWQVRQPASMHQLAEDAASYLNTQLLQYLRVLAPRRETTSADGWALFNRAWEHYRNSLELAANAELEAGLRVLLTADSLAIAAERADEDWLAPTLLRGRIAQRAMTWSRHPASKRTPAEIKTWAEAAIAQGDRALRRAPGNVDALELRGIAKYSYWSYLAGEQTRDDYGLLRSAERDLQDAAAGDAKRSQARIYLADIFHARAQFKEEKAMALSALDADPLAARDRNIIYRIALASFYLNQPVEALRMCRDGQQRHPEHVPFRYCELFVLAHADAIAPDVDRAWQITNDLAEPANAPPQRSQVPMFRMLTANVLARAGLQDSARAVIAQAAAAAPGSVSLMAPEAAAWTRLGEYERALDILEQDAAIDPVWIKATLLNPSFNPLRPQPRFRALVGKYISTGS